MNFRAWIRGARGGRRSRSRFDPRRASERGYSLLEVLIVLTIIGLIATLVGPRLMSQFDRSKTTAARVQVKALAAALETMRLDLGRYPTQVEGLNLLVSSATNADELWSGPYLEGSLPKDPWGKDYIYLPSTEPDARPRIGTLGADGKEGGEGNAADIYSDQS